jgi:hypothetical protein
MRLKLLCSCLVLFSTVCAAQTAKFEVLPYMDWTTSIKDSKIEAGPELNWNHIDSVDIGGVKIASKGDIFTLRPSLVLPLTDKTENVLQIDRFTSTWKGVLLLQYTIDNTEANGKVSRHSINGQFEIGNSAFKYYPTANDSYEQKVNKTSCAFEVIYIGYFSKGTPGAKQYSPQFRLRYSHEWKAANEVGVVNPVNSNGLLTTTDYIIDPPGVKPVFSPAFSLQVYPGKGFLSYSPAIYYDFTGKKGTGNPFGSLNRLRLESWVFFYPQFKENPNVKIGVSPVVSLRTKGTDGFNKIEYGGLITVKFGTTFLQFL